MYLSSFASIFLPIALALVLCFAVSCSHPPGCASSGKDSEIEEYLQASVQHLAGTIGERNLYHPEALATSAQWIEDEFRRMGYTPSRLPVEVASERFGLPNAVTAWNIEAVLLGSSLADEQLIVGAHYDSKVAMPRWNDHWPPTPESPGTPGANDNASGVGTVLAVAGHLAGQRPLRTVRFVAFVNEEPPFYQTEAMGSLVYARKLRQEGFKKLRMITPETLGCYSSRPRRKRLAVASVLGLPDRPDYIAFVGNWASRHWIREVAGIFAPQSGIDVRTVELPTVSKKVAWSDDWSFWRCGYPAFAITDTAYYRSDHYHETTDTPDTLDYRAMAEVVKALAQTVERVAKDPLQW